MRQWFQTTRIKTRTHVFRLMLGLTIALAFGYVSAYAQVDANDDAAPMAEPSDPVEGIGTDSEQPYDAPVEDYQDIEEEYGEEIIEEEPIYDEEPFPEEGESESEQIPLEDVDPDQLENPVEEDGFEFESEFEDYDPDALENPSEEEWDDTIGSEFEEIDPGEPEDPMEDDAPGAELE